MAQLQPPYPGAPFRTHEMSATNLNLGEPFQEKIVVGQTDSTTRGGIECELGGLRHEVSLDHIVMVVCNTKDAKLDTRVT